MQFSEVVVLYILCNFTLMRVSVLDAIQPADGKVTHMLFKNAMHMLASAQLSNKTSCCFFCGFHLHCEKDLGEYLKEPP